MKLRNVLAIESQAEVNDGRRRYGRAGDGCAAVGAAARALGRAACRAASGARRCGLAGRLGRRGRSASSVRRRLVGAVVPVASHIHVRAVLAYPTRGSTSRSATVAAHTITSSASTWANARRCDQLASAPSTATSAVMPAAPR